MRHRIGLGVAFVGSQVAMVWVLLGPLLKQPWLQGFRGYFANDQLSYAAIAINASNGVLTPVEPLTETGTSHYPSAWYLIVGITSLMTGQPIYRTWTVLGLAVIGASLAFLGFLAYKFSGLAFAPLLPGAALLTGTWSTITDGSWFTTVGSHAVIWGPFATFFTLNAEAIGLAAILFGMGLLMCARPNRKFNSSLIVVAATLFGALANVQTYAFITGSSVAVLFLASFALISNPSRTRLISTLTAITLVLIFGSTIVRAVGPLFLLILLLTATLPASMVLVRTHLRLTVATALAYGLAASPQVLRTVIGILNGDDFLTYRQASSVDLGVTSLATVLTAVPLVLAVAFIALTLLASKTGQVDPIRQTFSALLIALGAGALVFSTNDLWGFNQEPYRFWLQYSMIALLLSTVPASWALKRWTGLSRPWKGSVALIGVAAVAAWLGSLADVISFRAFAEQQGIIAVEDTRSALLREAVATDTGLILSSRCLDPQVLKLITGAPVVAFNRGLAWPENRTLIDSLIDPQREPTIRVEDLSAIGVSHVVTDTSCADEWSFADARFQPEEIAPYGAGTITVWQVHASQ